VLVRALLSSSFSIHLFVIRLIRVMGKINIHVYIYIYILCVHFKFTAYELSVNLIAIAQMVMYGHGPLTIKQRRHAPVSSHHGQPPAM